MPVYIALLRGINVGGHKRIKMADLRGLLESLGLDDVKTILQSGNVVFTSDESSHDELIRTIEAGIVAHYGFESKIILRRIGAFRDVVSDNPYADKPDLDASKLLVTFLASAPDADAMTRLREAQKGDEQVELVGQELYIYYPDGMGRSKLSNVFIQKHLKLVSTGRNWKTTNKLLALAEAVDSAG